MYDLPINSTILIGAWYFYLHEWDPRPTPHYKRPCASNGKEVEPTFSKSYAIHSSLSEIDLTIRALSRDLLPEIGWWPISCCDFRSPSDLIQTNYHRHPKGPISNHWCYLIVETTILKASNPKPRSRKTTEKELLETWCKSMSDQCHPLTQSLLKQVGRPPLSSHMLLHQECR